MMDDIAEQQDVAKEISEAISNPVAFGQVAAGCFFFIFFMCLFRSLMKMNWKLSWMLLVMNSSLKNKKNLTNSFLMLALLLACLRFQLQSQQSQPVYQQM